MTFQIFCSIRAWHAQTPFVDNQRCCTTSSSLFKGTLFQRLVDLSETLSHLNEQNLVKL